MLEDLKIGHKYHDELSFNRPELMAGLVQSSSSRQQAVKGVYEARTRKEKSMCKLN